MQKQINPSTQCLLFSFCSIFFNPVLHEACFIGSNRDKNVAIYATLLIAKKSIQLT